MVQPSSPQTDTLPPDQPQPWRPPRLAWLWVLLLALAYILPGLTGHPPWTQGEARTFGVIDGMATSGDLVVPALASDPILERPPGYAISAVGMVRLLDDWLPRHDAARLATGVYLALIFVFTGLLGRRAWGPGFGNMAVLALIGSIGLLAQGHLMSPDLALAAGMAMGLYGLLRAGTSVVWGGLWLGTGAGLGFLAQGLPGPAVLGITALVLPLLFGDWRNPGYLRALLVACVIAAPWLLAWPAALYLRDPGLFRLWWEAADPWRLLWVGGLHPTKPLAFWRQTLPWASFPLLPLALWTLLRHPQSAFGNPGVRLALVSSTVGWGLLFAAGSEHGLDALPLLVPLAVIAAGGVRSLPGWLVGLCYWLCVLVFATLALGLWGLWGFGLADGQPPQWPALGRYLPLDFRPTPGARCRPAGPGTDPGLAAHPDATASAARRGPRRLARGADPGLGPDLPAAPALAEPGRQRLRGLHGPGGASPGGGPSRGRVHRDPAGGRRPRGGHGLDPDAPWGVGTRPAGLLRRHPDQHRRQPGGGRLRLAGAEGPRGAAPGVG